ncbi:pro-resilin-like [Achroia grisella]|uniref:pro-resilin-like n=1 Tax=Achroia grisella TaxID=688607 RepID=UPI0027D21FE8|nr:pro-resilin-like [Achroia grisella]
MKILIVLAVMVASIIAEPPVDNRYLPPQQRGSSAPSQTYGPPNSSPGFGAQRQTDAVFGSRPSQSYGAPSSRNSRPSSTYGAPQPQSPSSQYGLPSASSQFRSQPSSQYGAPEFGQNRQNGRPRTPSSQYGAPRSAPSQQYGAPGSGSVGGGQYSGASNDFGAAQSRAYLPPGRGGYNGDDGSNGEPANYNFEYMVKDEQSGNDFGHRESRQGDRAEGVYYVVLPDGRKQTVEYEADQDGYKPRISYEDVGTGGYDRNSQSGRNQVGYQGNDAYQNQGYQNDGPY